MKVVFDGAISQGFERNTASIFTEIMSTTLEEIRLEWVTLLIKQHNRLQGVWRNYTPSYAKYKRSLYNNGAGTKADKQRSKIKSFDKLELTGRMMDQYVKGVRYYKTAGEVKIPYPSVTNSSGKQYAKYHQSQADGYKYSRHRKFELDEFRNLAVNTFDKYINKRING